MFEASQLLVRAATLDDAAAITTLNIATARTAYAPFYGPNFEPPSFEDRLTSWQVRLAAGSSVGTLLAVRDESILAFVCYGPNRDQLPASTGEVWALYVHADVWRRGIGTLLLTRAEEELAALGFREAVLWVLTPNAPARRFYEACGWQADGTSLPDEGHSDQVELRYAKTLATSRGG